MDYDTLLSIAQNRISELNEGHIFVVKDLFVGAKWNDLSKSDRQTFGRLFKNDVNNRQIENIKYIGKASNNSAQYKKLAN